jgi:ubiquinone/menaquinone biosynthesis C-methylase UbiE
MIQRWLGNQLKQPKGRLSKWIGLYMQRGNDSINRWTADLLEIKENDVLLEVGIGNGSTINRIVNNTRVGKVFGVDLSNEMIKEAEKRNKKQLEDGKVELHKGNIISLPYTDSVFDKVLSVHTLYFWPDINQGFSEVHRVLKPGGKLFLSITDKSQMEKMRRTKNFNLLYIEEIEKIIEINRFQIIKLHQKGVYWCIEATKS